MEHPQPEAHLRDVFGCTRFQVGPVGPNGGFGLFALLMEQAQPIVRIGGVFRFWRFQVGVEFRDGSFALSSLLKQHPPPIVRQAPEFGIPQREVRLVVTGGEPQCFFARCLLAGNQHRVVAFGSPKRGTGAMWRLGVLLDNRGKVPLRRRGVRTFLIKPRQTKMHLVRMCRILGFQILLIGAFRRNFLPPGFVERTQQVEGFGAVACVLGLQILLELLNGRGVLFQLQLQRSQPKPHFGDLLGIPRVEVVPVGLHRRCSASRLLLQCADSEV